MLLSMQHQEVCRSSRDRSLTAPVLGEPVAFTLSGPIPGSDSPAMTFPVDPLPSGIALLPVSRSAQTVLASGVSSQQDRWSSAGPWTLDVSWEARLITVPAAGYGPAGLSISDYVIHRTGGC